MTKISNQYSLTNVLTADTTNGRVGIGTETPSEKLSVIGNIRIDNGAADGGQLVLASSGSSDWNIDNFSGALRAYVGATERLRLTAAGNLGIGTASPGAPLSVVGNSSGYTLYSIGRNNADNASVISFRSNSAATEYAWIESGVNSQLDFGTNGNYRMRITSAGNVGIGTTSPENITNQTSLSVNGTNASRLDFQILGTKNSGLVSTAAGLYLETSTTIPLVFITNNTERMRITSGGYLKVANNGTYWFPTGTQHELNQSTTGSDTVILRNTSAVPYGMYMYFNTAPNNTTQYFIECSDGANTKISLYSNGSIYNRTGTYAAYSDIKLKENIVDATPKLDDLLKVKIRNYNLIGDELKQIGVIAQELEEIFPNMIDNTVDKDTGETTKGVKYSIFIPMLIKGLQEQQTQINELKALLNA